MAQRTPSGPPARGNTGGSDTPRNIAPHIPYLPDPFVDDVPDPSEQAGISGAGSAAGSSEGVGEPVDPLPDDMFEPHMAIYDVQWKPSAITPANRGANPVTRGCGCSGRRNNPGSAGDHYEEGGRSSEAETDISPYLALRGGDGSDAGDQHNGQPQGPYAGFEGWTEADMPKFRKAFSSEGLKQVRSSAADDWRDVLREHLQPTGPVDYDRYTIAELRKWCAARGLGVTGSARQPYMDALRADDDAGSSSGESAALERPGVSEPSTPERPHGNAPEGSHDNTPEGPHDEDPDAPDPALQARLRRLENLIASLENDDLSCNCPLNGQHVEEQPCHDNTQWSNRGLHIRLTAASDNQTVGPRDYWFPLAPQFDHQGVRLRVTIRPLPPTQSNSFLYRFMFSGPHEGGQQPALPRDAPLRNMIEFTLPFYIQAGRVGYDIWQEDIPDVPLLDTSGLVVVHQPQDLAGSYQQRTPAGNPDATLVSTTRSRVEADSNPTPRRTGRGEEVENIGDGLRNTDRRRTAAEAGLDQDASPSQRRRTA